MSVELIMMLYHHMTGKLPVTNRSETPQCVNSTVSRTLLSWTLGLGILDLILIILTHSARVVLTASHRLLSSNSRLTWQVECWRITIQKSTCDLFSQ